MYWRMKTNEYLVKEINREKEGRLSQIKTWFPVILKYYKHYKLEVYELRNRSVSWCSNKPEHQFSDHYRIIVRLYDGLNSWEWIRKFCTEVWRPCNRNKFSKINPFKRMLLLYNCKKKEERQKINHQRKFPARKPQLRDLMAVWKFQKNLEGFVRKSTRAWLQQWLRPVTWKYCRSQSSSTREKRCAIIFLLCVVAPHACQSRCYMSA